ncbi:hypothetical protein CRE_03125 [Caenorhabditis remanei]|uniref:Uncharacterized protein n=1 Tax=Caenorhabditis remanei TaxID=31234 RepID=E3LWN9_CAERE|nr:hypothetical protein CRE_03125 [Caenorhabditis remanei]
MEESQESNFSLSKFDANEDGSLSQYMSINECEREIQMLERDIRQQKESSSNAKTAITFGQLRKIHSLSTMLGPHKELFYERICRAAEIQRASLKNRLKSNINKFEPSTPLSFTQGGFDSSQNSLSASESQNFVVTPTTLHNLFNNSRKAQIEMLAPLASEEELMRFPAERQFDLMQIGFSYDEVKQLLEMFDKYKNDVQEINRHNTLTQVLNQFCNYISMYAPPNLKLISSAFNLLELGNPANEVKRVLLKARRREDSEESDVAPFVKKSCPSSQSPRSPNRDELLLGLDRSPPSDDGTQKV